MVDEDAKPSKKAVAPCAACGKPVSNPRYVGSLVFGRCCLKKVKANGGLLKLKGCPVCHRPFEKPIMVKVAEGDIEFPQGRPASLDDFILVSQPVIGDGNVGTDGNAGTRNS